MSRKQLEEMASINRLHAKNGTIELANKIVQIPASQYYDRTRWLTEIEEIFKRLPLVLGISKELKKPGDYKALEVVGMPVIINRNSQGKLNAFLNICQHKGAALVETGYGNSYHFRCPYHGWAYNDNGDLIGIPDNDNFGDLDKGCNGLITLPIEERAGIIWVTLDPKSELPIDSFLSGYDKMLAHFKFEDWYVFDTRTLKGPNWKVAYDGYLDLYHLPVLHHETFGTEISNKAMFYAWGPHQRVISPARLSSQDDFEGTGMDYNKLPIKEIPTEVLMTGVWTIFPHVSIASFNGGGRSVLLSQLLPGENPEESYTVQYYLMEKEPNEKQREEAKEQFKFLQHVVKEEDYATGLKLQKGLKTGKMKSVLFGRNEGGGQVFHNWVNQLIKTKDKDLLNLFKK